MVDIRLSIVKGANRSRFVGWCSPGLQSGERVFKPAGMLRYIDLRALALVGGAPIPSLKMPTTLPPSIISMVCFGNTPAVKGALQAGATPEEIMTVLQLCVSMGVQACAKGAPILAEELEHTSDFVFTSPE
jgi:hypothetical protein